MSDKRRFSIKAAPHINSADIFLYDDIGGDGIRSKQFIDELQAAGEVRQIVLHINSNGGSVFDGIAIYTALANHGAEIVVSIEGVAASIASVIAMAGHEIHAAADALIMIHSPWMATTGNPQELRKSLDLLDKVEAQILGIYKRRTGLDEETLRAMMAEETWLDPAEAIAAGLVDYISAPTEIAAKADLSRFNNPPHHLARKFGIATGRTSKARKQIATRARVERCQRRATQILKDRNQLN